MATIIDKLVYSLSFELDPGSKKDINEFSTSARGAAKNITLLAAGVTAAATALVLFTRNLSQTNDELGKSAESLGLQVEDLDALTFAAEIAAGSADGLVSSLIRLNQIASEAARGVGEGVDIFGRLGISVTDTNGRVRNTIDLLSLLAEGLPLLESRAEQVEIAEKLGLSNFLLLLDQGSDGIQKLIAEAQRLGVVTSDQARSAAEFNDSWTRLTRVITNFLNVAQGKLAPTLDVIAQGIQKIISENKEFLDGELENALELLNRSLGIGLGLLSRLVTTTRALISGFGGLNAILRILSAILFVILSYNIGVFLQSVIGLVLTLTASLNLLGIQALITQAKILLIPLAIGSLLVLIGLVIDDIVTFLKTGDSFFARLLGRFEVLNAHFEGFSSVLLFVYESILALLELVQNPLDSSAWENFFNRVLTAAESMVLSVSKAMLSLVDAVLTPFRYIAKRIGFDVPELADSVPDSVGLSVDSIAQGLQEALDFGANLFNSQSAANVTQQTIASTANQANTSINRETRVQSILNSPINITVDSSVANSESIQKAIEEGAKRANFNFKEAFSRELDNVVNQTRRDGQTIIKQ